MKVIWKFQLAEKNIQEIEMPIGATVVHVASQFERPCLWAECDPLAEKEMRKFGVVATGQQFEGTYVGTFMLNGGALVFHVIQP